MLVRGLICITNWLDVISISIATFEFINNSTHKLSAIKLVMIENITAAQFNLYQIHTVKRIQLLHFTMSRDSNQGHAICAHNFCTQLLANKMRFMRMWCQIMMMTFKTWVWNDLVRNVRVHACGLRILILFVFLYNKTIYVQHTAVVERLSTPLFN